MNRERMAELADIIEQDKRPEGVNYPFSMDGFMTCAAGWAVAQWDNQAYTAYNDTHDHDITMDEIAAKLLDLTRREADDLFYDRHYPKGKSHEVAEHIREMIAADEAADKARDD